MASWGWIERETLTKAGGGNFPAWSVFTFFVYRLILILALLAAALPAAASAQTPATTPPVAATGAAEAISETGATLTGTVDRNDGPTTYHFEYGTSAAYGLNTAETPVSAAGTDPVTVKAAIQSLTRDTLYHYRLVATNPAGVSRGADRSFRTAPGPRAPAVASTSSRDVFSRGARLITTADPNGQETSVHFQYGTSTRYGAFSDSVSAGSGDRGVPVSIPLGGLKPNTRYHFRAVATNATGSARSLDRSFRTPREPTGVSLSLTPSRPVWAGRVTVLGRVAGTSVGGTPVALERQDFPFRAGFTQVGATKSANGDGSFRFELPSVFVTTQVRVVTRTKVVVTSPVRTASSAVRVGASAGSIGPRRSRIQGSIWPRVPAGRVSLQKRSPRGHWAVVSRKAALPLDANRSRYRFTVRRGKRAGIYRVAVVARDGGAHVPGRSREVRVRARRGARRAG
jgi:hypothetical protein